MLQRNGVAAAPIHTQADTVGVLFQSSKDEIDRLVQSGIVGTNKAALTASGVAECRLLRIL